ncbi:MAG: hypothetical protein ACI9GW_001972 [Halieaceae bacterium]|jgi:hypothetical protein
MTAKITKCPYCDGDAGYYFIEQVRQNVWCNFDGIENSRSADMVQYTGSKLRCIKCDETITSFVHGVHKELDNE